MVMRALGVGGLCGLVLVSCGTRGNDPNATGSGPLDTRANSVVGTWDLTTTPLPGVGSGAMTTLVVGQDSLTITSPDFTLTATRTGKTLAFTDEQTLGDPTDDVTLTATQTAGTFNAGIVPFDLGGSWTMQIVPAGKSVVLTCNLSVSATEIDGACQKATPGDFFSFTSKKTASAASSFGDFGGTWTNNWTWAEMGGGTFPCALDFTGPQITTCPAPTGNANGNNVLQSSPLAGITFNYDGANTASGTIQGWAEYSATRR